MYQAMYRKYRPTVFDDVVGQEHITAALKHEVATGKTSHAYLFTGSRGTGKTTCSKLLAKAVNCLAPQSGNPCGTCAICRGVDEGSVLDVTEIDAASNNGVDNIRQLREEAYFLPAQAQKRVYIIDETHMLSIGAFNALLKIMEEPPAHVLFILATTEAHKIPATILSRCQRFDFKRIENNVIADRLDVVAQHEQVALERDAALLIARLAEGGMRDALSLLDLCASHNREINMDVVTAAAGLAGREALYQLTDAVAVGDTAAALSALADLYARGADLERLCGELIGHYRDLMIFKSAQRPDELLPLPPQDLQRMAGQVEHLHLSQIFYSLTVLQDTLTRMTRSTNRRTDLELGLVRLCDPGLDTSPEALLARIERLENGFVPRGAMPPHQSPVRTETAPAARVQPTTEPKQPAEHSKPQPADTAAPMEPLQSWSEVLARLSKLNPALHGALHGSSAYVQGDLCLIDSTDELFFQLIRKSEVAKSTLREAIAQETGCRYRLGPYKQEKQAPPPVHDPLDELERQAREAGVTVEIQS